jgi:hypothetical protein
MTVWPPSRHPATIESSELKRVLVSLNLRMTQSLRELLAEAYSFWSSFLGTFAHPHSLLNDGCRTGLVRTRMLPCGCSGAPGTCPHAVVFDPPLEAIRAALTSPPDELAVAMCRTPTIDHVVLPLLDQETLLLPQRLPPPEGMERRIAWQVGAAVTAAEALAETMRSCAALVHVDEQAYCVAWGAGEDLKRVNQYAKAT